jgi:hypothetical protein
MKTGARAAALALLGAWAGCGGETNAPGGFEASATGALTEPSLTGSAVAWLNVAGGQRHFEIRLNSPDDAARHIVLTMMSSEWPVEGTYQVTENAPAERTFDLIFTLDANRLVRGTRGTVEITGSSAAEVTGRFQADGVLIDLTSPGGGMPAVRLEGTFRATCSEQSGETVCG